MHRTNQGSGPRGQSCQPANAIVHLLCAPLLLFAVACEPITPGGADANTLSCDHYCAEITRICTGANAQYESEVSCKANCETFVKIPAGTVGDRPENSIGCRVYHTGRAAIQNAELHCVHAGVTGGNLCGSWCENYCHLARNNCTGADAIYDSDQECMTACMSFDPTGTPGDETGNTVQCRMTWLIAAAVEPPATLAHCVDGGPTSNVCI